MPAERKLSGFRTTTNPAPKNAVGSTTHFTKALHSLGMVTYRNTARLKVTKGCDSRKPKTEKKDGGCTLKEGSAYGKTALKAREIQ